MIALDDLVAALELLVVLILNTQSFADVIDAVLVGGGVVPAWRLVANRVGILPFGVNVTSCQLGAGFGVPLELGFQFVMARSGGRDHAGVGHFFDGLEALDVGEHSTVALECRRSASGQPAGCG